MGFLQLLKSVLGIGGSAHAGETETRVTVERKSDRDTPPPTERAGSDRRDPAATGVDEAEPQDQPGESVTDIKGIGPAYAERLEAAGVESVGDLATADAAELAAATEISETRLQNWIDRAGAR